MSYNCLSMDSKRKSNAGSGQKLLALVAVAIACVVVLALKGPIPQEPNYHSFADLRAFVGVPHFFDVVSNLPFIVLGTYGLYLLYYRHLPGLLPPLRPIYAVFFMATVLVGFGSTYYHLAPDNIRLMWDRLPMSILFMAFLLIVVGEQISAVWARRLLVPLIVVGIGSVGYWAVTESIGAGDLRPYVAVQYFPLILTPLMLILFSSVYERNVFMWLVPIFYLSAKLCEWLDEPVYELTGFISGHTLKHLLAALAVLFLILALRYRYAKRAS